MKFQEQKQQEYQNMVFFKKGCTQNFNFYDTKMDSTKIVDGPSYGNGDFSYKIKHQNKKLIKNYITFSTRLAKIFFVIDLSQGIDITDRIMFNYMKHLKLPIQIVFNKIDKVSCDLIYTKVFSISQPFSIYEDIIQSEVLLTSTKTGYGIQELKKSVKQSLQECTTREIFFKAGKVSYLPIEELEIEDQI